MTRLLRRIRHREAVISLLDGAPHRLWGSI